MLVQRMPSAERVGALSLLSPRCSLALCVWLCRSFAPRALPCAAQAATKQATATRSEITLRGSVEIVTEFFGYAINK